MFQSLIGRLLTFWLQLRLPISPAFQSLIGRLLTPCRLIQEDIEKKFQSLIGRLLTGALVTDIEEYVDGFNPL